MQQSSVGFKSKGTTLEGIVSTPRSAEGSSPGAVLYHPHPLFGGSMYNAVVTALVRALEEAGIASLRFNFRGVGNSEGKFSNGKYETLDAAAALKTFRRWPGIDGSRLALVGYSFGAQVILKELSMYKAAKALVFISPPKPSFDGSSVGKDTRPKLFIVGERDRLVGATQLQERVATFQTPARMETVRQGDHSWTGLEGTAAAKIVKFLQEVL